MVTWKLARSRRSEILHAYEIPLSPRPGQEIPSLCLKSKHRVGMFHNSDRGKKCLICVARHQKQERTSGDLDL